MSIRAIRRRVPLALCALVLLAPLVAPRAEADVLGAATLLSADASGQAEYAHDAALSEDGRYVVFDGKIGGVQGIWRREVKPGASFEQVAGGDATLPSISADGRYVSFTTNEGASLPAITNGRIQEGEPAREAVSVYVRDMDKQRVRNPESAEAEFEPGAFTLASAKNHSTQSLTYEFPGAEGVELEGDIEDFGALAGGRSAISADGRTVAFVTTAQSDLAGPGTPPMQVAVRRLDSDETMLVSVRIDQATGRPALNSETGAPEPVPSANTILGTYGGAWAPFSAAFPSNFANNYQPSDLPGAAISADGSAVAWYGGQIAEQVRMLSAEHPRLESAAPLWRRVSGGEAEATRLVAGASDPEGPSCLSAPEPTPGPRCQGPFIRPGLLYKPGASAFVPRLSRNGDYVAFLASEATREEGEAFGLAFEERNTDVYRQDMTAPDMSSDLRRVTRFASGDTGRVATNANVTDLAISPDGQQIAFTTARTVFPVQVPAYVSPPAAVPGLGELYDADLADQTLTRATIGYEGGQPEHPEIELGNEDRYGGGGDGALSPSFGAEGQLLAFSDTASNLVFGDGNSPPNRPEAKSDGADVFILPRISFSLEPTPQAISVAPANPTLEPPWRIQVSASSLPGGRVRLRVRVPAAGHLAASAVSSLPRRTARGRSVNARRVVANASAAAPSSGATLTLTLTLAGHYRPLARTAGGLAAKASVSFAAKGHPTLRATLPIHFRIPRAHRAARSGRR